MFKKRFYAFLTRFNDDEVFLLAGSLAYTTGLAMAPFVIIMLSLILLIGNQWDKSLIDEISALLGNQAAEAIRMVIASTKNAPVSFGISNLLEVVVLGVSASTIFAQLRAAFDKIDHYTPPKDKVSGVWIFVKERLFCIQLVFGFAFMAVTSLLVTAALAALLPSGDARVGKLIALILNVVVFMFLFTSMFRFIPSSRYSWRRCLMSSFSATMFFLIGKTLIGIYLGRVAVGSAYGAAGSLVVFLVWVYYTALTLLLSYEFTIELIEIPSEDKKPAARAKKSN